MTYTRARVESTVRKKEGGWDRIIFVTITAATARALRIKPADNIHLVAHWRSGVRL